MTPSLPVFYSCRRCPAYCCSYPRIEVTKDDLKRLSRQLGIGLGATRKRMTQRDSQEGKRILKHRRDETFGSVCLFLDEETRQCKVYTARPTICRDFPGSVRCGYYDFLCFERRMLDDQEYVSTTYNF